MTDAWPLPLLLRIADVIHPFPAFNRMLGESLEELAAKAARRTDGGTKPVTSK